MLDCLFINAEAAEQWLEDSYNAASASPTESSVRLLVRVLDTYQEQFGVVHPADSDIEELLNRAEEVAHAGPVTSDGA